MAQVLEKLFLQKVAQMPSEVIVNGNGNQDMHARCCTFTAVKSIIHRRCIIK